MADPGVETRRWAEGCSGRRRREVTGGRSKAQAGPSEQTRPEAANRSRAAGGAAGRARRRHAARRGGRAAAGGGGGGGERCARRRRARATGGGRSRAAVGERRAGARRCRQGRSPEGVAVGGRRDLLGAGTGPRVRLLGHFFHLGYKFYSMY
ncbi:hypothetical protein PVAP13_6NG063860 [Panicum virgatum]|uniref:Uncharacterized protein n=1 Tax=Panicum virgatum TaxID=38727 RepID=A0A8T0QUQ4_PANVG|nr:hypothetical protein PVAP13_6NG063860 [Panicum virgatum]